MSIKKRIIEILFIIFNISLSYGATPVVIEQTGAANITVDCNFDTVYHTISENLIGFDMTYSFCSNNFWKNTGIKPALTNMKTGFIRYPDGEPTSYYHWNNLNGQGYMDNWDPAYNHKNDQDPKNYTDVDEYIAICRETGAKPLVGINMESGLLYNRVNDGIEEAKALVKYCLDNNYGVKYFFLDNEPYNSNSHYVMTVDEYIEQIKLYAPELKKINPDIKLIVNWDANLENGNFWKLLIQTHDLIDYMDVHWYWSWGTSTFSAWCDQFPMNTNNQWYQSGRTYKQELEYFNTQAKIKGVSNIKLISLEWNVGPSENLDVSPNAFQCALIQSEMLMQFMDGNMDMAALWTIFWINKNGTPQFTNRYLMDYYNNYSFLPCYDMFKLLSGALGKQKCGIACDTNTVYPLAVKSNDNKEKNIFLMNKGKTESSVAVKAPRGDDFKLEIFSMDGVDTSVGSVKTASCTYDEVTQTYLFMIPAFSLSKLTIKIPNHVYVSTATGNDLNSGKYSDNALKTISKAVEIAEFGDSICVSAGTYTEQNININKNITILGANTGTTIIQAQSTAPDGTAPVANNSIIVLAGTANVTLNNLTLRYGNSTSAGGAIAVSAGQTLTVENCNILNCYTLWGGGGISSVGNLTINNSAIANNTANANGGGINAPGGTVSITNSVIFNNTSRSVLGTGGNGGGGAIFLKDATLSLKNNTIAYNKCTVAEQHNLGVRMEGTGTSAITKNTLNTNNLFFNSINNAYTSGVDIGAAYNTYYADAANNTNNIFSFAYLPALSNTTIPSTDSNYPTAAQVALGTFAMGSNGVYSLTILTGSIAIGAANPATATATDIHGTTRTTPDIGAFEWKINSATPVEQANSEIFICSSLGNGSFNFSNLTGKGGRLEIYNMSGERIFVRNVSAGNTTLQLPNLAKGVVMLLFFYERGVNTRKLFVVN